MSFDIKQMSEKSLEDYIERDKYTNECKAEWLRRYGADYPFKGENE